MKKIFFVFTFPLLLLGVLPGFSDVYHFEIDNHTYDLEYQIDANVIAMAVDQELNSLLIGIENTDESNFLIKLPNEMISAKNNEFAVLVDGFEVDYQINSLGDKTEIIFFVPALSQEIEIIGTHVIPEFSYGMMILLLTIASMVIFTKKSNLRIK